MILSKAFQKLKQDNNYNDLTEMWQQRWKSCHTAYLYSPKLKRDDQSNIRLTTVTQFSKNKYILWFYQKLQESFFKSSNHVAITMI